MVTKLCSGQEMLYKINQRGIIKKRNKVELWFLSLHFESLPEACIPSLESFGHMMTKLRSGQGKRDAEADTDADDAADKSNTLYVAFLGDTKRMDRLISLTIKHEELYVTKTIT